MAKKDLHLRCPDCGSRLRVDPDSGEVIAHGREEPAAGFAEAARRAQQREENKGDAFSRALEQERRHKEDVEDAFRKAADKARRSGPDEEPDGDHPMDDRWR